MKRILIVAVLQLAAFAVGAAAIVLFFLDHLLEPIGDAMSVAYFAAWGAMTGLTVAVMTVAIRQRRGTLSASPLAAMMILTAVAGFLPIVVRGFVR